MSGFWCCPNDGILAVVQVTWNERCSECGSSVDWVDGEKDGLHIVDKSIEELQKKYEGINQNTDICDEPTTGSVVEEELHCSGLRDD